MISFLPSLLFFIGGIGVVVFIVIALSSGTILRKKLLNLSSTQLKPITLFDQIFHNIQAKTILFLRTIGLYRDHPFYESFRKAQGWLKENVDGDVYQLPWYAVVGEEASGKGALLKNLKLSQPANHPLFPDNDLHPSLEWLFFDQGILLSLSGASFLNKEGIGPRQTWKDFLKNLINFRVELPLNGFILTIPASYFVGDQALTSDEIFRRASLVSQQLRHAEMVLGLRLPVYVIITKCDEISGFNGFVNALPLQRQQDIFGWSSPYILDEAYSPTWISDAFSGWTTSLTELSLDLCTQENVQHPDEMMTFVFYFSNIARGLSEYLNAVFKTHNYRQHLILRGIYCTGELPVSGTFPFLTSLFKDKIFPEQWVVTPLKNFLISANQKINLMKWVIAVCVIASFVSLKIGKDHAREGVQELYASYTALYKSLLHFKQDDALQEEVKRPFFRHRAENVYGLILKSNATSMLSPYLPAAYFLKLDKKEFQSLQIAFYVFISRSIFFDLIAKMNKIIRSPIPVVTLEASFSPLETTEFSLLQGYVDAIQLLEKNVHLYQNLNHDKSFSGLGSIVNYIYEFQVTEDVIQSTKEFAAYIFKTVNFKSLPWKEYQVLAERRLYTLFLNFLNRALDPAQNYKFAIELQKILERINHYRTAIPSLKELQAILSQLIQLKNFLQSPDALWFGESDFNPGPAYQETMMQIANTKIFGLDVVRTFSAEANRLFSLSQRNFKNFGSTLTGNFVTLTSNNTIELSPRLSSFQSLLSNFLNKPFMQPIQGEENDSKPRANEFIFWDKGLLMEAATLIKSYTEFAQKSVSAYPSDLREPFRLLAQHQLYANVNNRIRRAQKIVAIEEGWRESSRPGDFLTHVTNLISVLPHFYTILEYLQESGNTSLFFAIRDLVFEQAYQALDGVDKYLQEQALYQPFYETFDWWKGGPFVMAKAFDLLDADGMHEYLATQRKQITQLAQMYAEPLVKFLTSNFFDAGLAETKVIEKWKQILETLVNYAKKKPTNHLSKLEKFLTDTGNTLTFETCFKDIPSKEPLTGNFFEAQIISIKSRIFQQCKSLAAQTAVAKFNALSDYFNTSLAGLFPFVEKAPETTIVAGEASPSAIISFFDLYDALSPQERKALLQDPTLSNKTQIQNFLAMVGNVKKFLNTYFMPQTPNGTPGLNFTIEFRANQLHELHGNHVISWGFAVGEKTFELRTGQTTGRWEWGQPVSFGFKWAANAPAVPLSQDPATPSYTRVGQRALFLYEGTWAILRAMMLHQASQTAGAIPGNNTLLSFKIPLGAENDSVTEAFALLFIKITPRAPRAVAGNPFFIPRFPSVAPLLERKSS